MSVPRQAKLRERRGQRRRRGRRRVPRHAHERGLGLESHPDQPARLLAQRCPRSPQAMPRESSRPPLKPQACPRWQRPVLLRG